MKLNLNLAASNFKISVRIIHEKFFIRISSPKVKGEYYRRMRTIDNMISEDGREQTHEKYQDLVGDPYVI